MAANFPLRLRQSHFELLILILILYSMTIHFVELEFHDTEKIGPFFVWSERAVALTFTVEYFVRWIASRRLSYPFSLMAMVDLLAILPFYLGFLVDLRSLRLVRTARVFRLFKLYRYTYALKSIRNAFNHVRYEFWVIGFAVLTLGWICSVAVYEFEKDVQPEVFTKLSDAIWYTVTTLTTVGYGDKVPVTLGGRLVAIFMMICGLVLFGTFVSLIGSAFLEELRKNPRRAGTKLHLQHSEFLVHEIDASPHGFDPSLVLKAIDAGSFHMEDERSRVKAIRLLTTACQLLEREKS